eukprot:m.7046 g.7046  ORF g.7046 m.7046 type:complete len:998 (-) comp5065_c0_seq2:61-3054(-)
MTVESEPITSDNEPNIATPPKSILKKRNSDVDKRVVEDILKQVSALYRTGDTQQRERMELDKALRRRRPRNRDEPANVDAKGSLKSKSSPPKDINKSTSVTQNSASRQVAPMSPSLETPNKQQQSQHGISTTKPSLSADTLASSSPLIPKASATSLTLPVNASLPQHEAAEPSSIGSTVLASQTPTTAFTSPLLPLPLSSSSAETQMSSSAKATTSSTTSAKLPDERQLEELMGRQKGRRRRRRPRPRPGPGPDGNEESAPFAPVDETSMFKSKEEEEEDDDNENIFEGETFDEGKVPISVQLQAMEKAATLWFEASKSHGTRPFGRIDIRRRSHLRLSDGASSEPSLVQRHAQEGRLPTISFSTEPPNVFETYSSTDYDRISVPVTYSFLGDESDDPDIEESDSSHTNVRDSPYSYQSETGVDDADIPTDSWSTCSSVASEIESTTDEGSKPSVCAKDAIDDRSTEAADTIAASTKTQSRPFANTIDHATSRAVEESHQPSVFIQALDSHVEPQLSKISQSSIRMQSLPTGSSLSTSSEQAKVTDDERIISSPQLSIQISVEDTDVQEEEAEKEEVTSTSEQNDHSRSLSTTACQTSTIPVLRRQDHVIDQSEDMSEPHSSTLEDSHWNIPSNVIRFTVQDEDEARGCVADYSDHDEDDDSIDVFDNSLNIARNRRLFARSNSAGSDNNRIGRTQQPATLSPCSLKLSPSPSPRRPSSPASPTFSLCEEDSDTSLDHCSKAEHGPATGVSSFPDMPDLEILQNCSDPEFHRRVHDRWIKLQAEKRARRRLIEMSRTATLNRVRRESLPAGDPQVWWSMSSSPKNRPSQVDSLRRGRSDMQESLQTLSVPSRAKSTLGVRGEYAQNPTAVLKRSLSAPHTSPSLLAVPHTRSLEIDSPFALPRGAQSRRRGLSMDSAFPILVVDYDGNDSKKEFSNAIQITNDDSSEYDADGAQGPQVQMDNHSGPALLQQRAKREQRQRSTSMPSFSISVTDEDDL